MTRRSDHLSPETNIRNVVRVGEGPLSAEEIEALRLAYRRGAKGSAIVGMLGLTRLLTQFLPPQKTEEATTRAMLKSAARLLDIGCDGYIHVRRGILTDALGAGDCPILIADECLTDGNGESLVIQEIVGIDDPRRAWRRHNGERVAEDRLSRALHSCLTTKEANPGRKHLRQ